MVEAELHDGSRIAVEVTGEGPVVLLPLDTAAGGDLADGLADRFRVVAAGYGEHRRRVPAPGGLTPDVLAADLLAVADAAGAERFACCGSSWLGLAALQLALRTDRLTALAVGGFPPLGAPYPQLLAAAAALPPPERDQLVPLYEALQGFDERAALARAACPRLCFAGSDDVTAHGEHAGAVTVDLAGPLVERRAELEAAGWTVEVLPGLDGTGAARPAVLLGVVRPWLAAVLLGDGQGPGWSDEPDQVEG